MTHWTGWTAAAIATLLPAALLGQTPPRMSQHGTVSQTITGVTITVEYDRPTARGRELRDGIIHWNEWWTPGANWATTVAFDGPVMLGGHRLDAGRYSLWTIPTDDEWTVVFSENDSLYHTQAPPGGEALRYTTRAAEGPYMDALTFYFPEVGPNTTTLHMRWGDIVLPLHFTVDAWPEVQLSERERQQYVGAYDLDGTHVEIVDEGERLGIVGLPWAGGGTIALVAKGRHRFNYGLVMDGLLREVYTPETEVVFTVHDDHVNGFEVREGAEVRSRAARR